MPEPPATVAAGAPLPRAASNRPWTGGTFRRGASMARRPQRSRRLILLLRFRRARARRTAPGEATGRILIQPRDSLDRVRNQRAFQCVGG